MILKSFEIENNLSKLLKYKFILIYGENAGLKEDLKKKIITLKKKAEIINLYQEDVLKNKDVLLNEVQNTSLFSEEKIIILNQINDKYFAEIEGLLNRKENIIIILIGDLLEKKSKLRNLFEKKTNLGIIPCYQDNEITLRNLIKNELSDFKNLETNLINMIINYSNLNRKTIKNNLDKIKSFYDKRILSEDSLETLLNSDRNEMFENIRDAALSGDKLKLNDLLDNFVFSNEDVYQYLNMINYRFIKSLNIHKQNESYNDLNVTISKMKPPVFWKDRPVYLKMLKKWDKQSVIEVLKYLAKVENKIKKNSTINSLTIIKNSITNICANSWTYF